MMETVSSEKRKNQRRKMIAGRVKKTFFTLLAVLFWVGIWWLFALKVGKAWILPTPDEVLGAFAEALKGGELLVRAGKSLRGILEGYFCGMTAGLLLAVLTAAVPFLHVLFSPLLTVVRATPVASFILILWVFFARGDVPAVSVGLIVLPIVWANCETGILSASRKLLEMAKVYHLSFWTKLRYLYLPAVYPYFRTAALTALGMAWKAGIAAEVLCTPDKTIGQMIWYAKRDIATADLFAWTLTVIFLCFLLEKLFALLLPTMLRRKIQK